MEMIKDIVSLTGFLCWFTHVGIETVLGNFTMLALGVFLPPVGIINGGHILFKLLGL